MRRLNGDLLLTHPAEVSKFYLSPLGIRHKWMKFIKAWIICWLHLTTRGSNGWSVDILRWLDWSQSSKIGTQSILIVVWFIWVLSPSLFMNGPAYLTRGIVLVINIFKAFCCKVGFWEVFLIFCGSLSIFIFHLSWFHGIYFQYSQVLVIVLLSKKCSCFPDLMNIY